MKGVINRSSASWVFAGKTVEQGRGLTAPFHFGQSQSLDVGWFGIFIALSN